MLLSPKEQAKSQTPLEAPLQENHQFVTLPGFIYTPEPKLGQKIDVSLINQSNPKVILNARLHQIAEDPMSESGQRAKLEVSKETLKMIRGQKGLWDIFPGQNRNSMSGGPYEVIL